jgi:serine/threonine protein kinase
LTRENSQGSHGLVGIARQQSQVCLFQQHFKHQELLQEWLGVAADLADAIAYLHQHSIVHWDLKPSNIDFD